MGTIEGKELVEIDHPAAVRVEDAECTLAVLLRQLHAEVPSQVHKLLHVQL
jgi:hypothetical protein